MALFPFDAVEFAILQILRQLKVSTKSSMPSQMVSKHAVRDAVCDAVREAPKCFNGGCSSWVRGSVDASERAIAMLKKQDHAWWCPNHEPGDRVSHFKTGRIGTVLEFFANGKMRIGFVDKPLVEVCWQSAFIGVSDATRGHRL